MHSGKMKMDLVSSLEILSIEEAVWKQERIHGDKPPLGIRDCGLALLQSRDGTNRLRPFIFGGFCGHSACMHNSVHELCFDPEQVEEKYKWNEVVANESPGGPLKKRGAAAVAFADGDAEQVCVFAGRGPSNSAAHQPPPTEYIPNVYKDVPCWTNELHFVDLKKGKMSTVIYYK